MEENMRSRQLSMWDQAPEDAFTVYRNVDTGLSKAVCRWVFYDAENKLVRDDASPEIKAKCEQLIS